MHKSYAIQDGCHNCGACATIFGWLICVSDKCKPGDDPDMILRGLEDMLRGQVQPAGKCDEWKARA